MKMITTSPMDQSGPDQDHTAVKDAERYHRNLNKRNERDTGDGGACVRFALLGHSQWLKPMCTYHLCGSAIYLV